MMNRKVFRLLFALVSLTLLSFIYPQFKNTEKSSSPSATPTSSLKQASDKNKSDVYTVTRVIDGDTIEIDNGRKVRYIGIDTPEIKDPRKKVRCFGYEASAKNKELVLGKTVRLEKDVSETDKYGRLLRYVYVGDVFVNDYLVRQGFAHAASFPPDIKYQEKFRQAQVEARENKRGFWLNCY